MPKTKESIAAYNKEYFARPEVIARAKVRNAQRRDKRAEYKKTEQGKEAEKRYRNKPETKILVEFNRIFNRYGLTEEQYKQMYFEQDNSCAICHEHEGEKLHVDHDHETLRVRGLLCGNCNKALGLMKDNTDYLDRAIEYLERDND